MYMIVGQGNQGCWEGRTRNNSIELLLCTMLDCGVLSISILEAGSLGPPTIAL